jgi:DNA-binding transcriptional MerR regulator
MLSRLLLTLYSGIGFKKFIMMIGQVAKEAQVNVQTLRYYERVGIIKPTSRDASGYRHYNQDAVTRVNFIKRAQELGFSLEEVKELLALRGNSAAGRASARKRASEKLIVIHDRIKSLQALAKTLQELIRDCEQGNPSGPCPILEKMEGKKK